ncbi:membrane-associated zinc metalloprotease [Aquipluma nitroreducens]|uniref:Zinc metalloprotease n=2 Tax=Aquipluma nitroreducens TaxID=2010828 RepID=A0A5K7S7X8_9BACT|nr:membrane-associated zinc metalloprotease [Aquipluma nitroreducens]
MFARLFKTRVEKFYLFFDPWFSLFKVKKGDTEYGVGWLPLGGYVKISGMIDESMDKEAMKLPAQPYEFRAKKTWQRLLIMVGGVVMNFILAFVIYIGILYAWGESYLPTANVKYGIEVDSIGMKVGFQNGDKILSVANRPVEDFRKVVPTIILDKASAVQVERNGEKVDVEISDEDLALMIKNRLDMSFRIPFNYKIAKIAKDSPAKEAGLNVGDQILGMDSLKYEYNDQFKAALREHIGKKITLNVMRNNQAMAFPIVIPPSGALGIALDLNLEKIFELKTIEYSLVESIPAGINRGLSTISDYLKQFKLIFSPKTKAYESLGGFIAIGNIFPGAWSWFSFWSMTAFLSIILGVMNLLPIPALDGGHVMFLLFEMITGRKPGDKFLEYAQIAGMVVLLSLVLFANLNDIYKLFK